MAGKNELKKILEEVVAGNILYDEPMSCHTSLQVGGRADALVLIEHEKQLADMVRRLRARDIKFFVAGNLTNVIVRDGGYRGAILVMTGMKEIKCEQIPDSHYLLYAQAGASLMRVVSKTVEEELTGLEFCSGIPGSVGGAVWMNAGAYGKEMKDVIESISVLDTDGFEKSMKAEEISFGYRKTDLPDDVIILGARFKLEKGERSEIKKRINEIVKSRQEKHPLDFPSAGSVFKNLPGMPAGKLIEEMGLKGTGSGGAQISSKHGNFIVNKQRARASDILRLIELIKSRARKEKGVTLDTEVVIIGED